MFNDYFILQLLVILILLFINYTQDLFFTVLNSILYLALISIYAWLDDADILINFLIIIDLGVFFILLAFVLNIIKMFTFQDLYLNNYYNTLIFFFGIGFILFQWYFSASFALYLTNYYLIIYNFLITFYNWYSLYTLLYFTDLQLLSEIYFHFNFFEFILMNFIIYFTIALIYFILSYSILVKSIDFLSLPLSFIKFNKFNNHFFIKSQNLQNQILTKANLRVWSRTNFKIKNGFKTNLSKFNW